jgi:hypothetical protein
MPASTKAQLVAHVRTEMPRMFKARSVAAAGVQRLEDQRTLDILNVDPTAAEPVLCHAFLRHPRGAQANGALCQPATVGQRPPTPDPGLVTDHRARRPEFADAAASRGRSNRRRLVGKGSDRRPSACAKRALKCCASAMMSFCCRGVAVASAAQGPAGASRLARNRPSAHTPDECGARDDAQRRTAPVNPA